jgi:CBS domain-containing protein
MNNVSESQLLLPDEESVERFLPGIVVKDLRRSLRTLMKPAFTLPVEASVAEAIEQMKTKRHGCVLLVQNKRLVGIFTERDILKKIIGATFDLETTPIASVMTPTPHALWADDTIAYALNFMDLGGYRHIPIVDNMFEPVGMVSVKDIITYLVQHFADEVLNLPAHPLAYKGDPDFEFNHPGDEGRPYEEDDEEEPGV